MTNISAKYKIFLTFLLFAMIYPSIIHAASKKPFVIVIDAGHGGKDVGAVDNGVKEKDINLGVALQLGELLKKKMKDAEVIFTRSDDTYLTLQQRADKANAAKGNLFISIHTNSLDMNNPKRSTVEGASVYVLGLHKDDNNMKVAQRENAVIKLETDFEEKYEGFNPQKDESYIIFEMAQKKNLSNSIKFAELAEKNLKTIGERKGRGVHQAGFWVLWATAMPGALVEVDFICNPESAEFLSSSGGQKKLAEALFKAVEQYRKDLKLAEKQPKKTDQKIAADGSAVTIAQAQGGKIKTDAPKMKASKNSNLHTSSGRRHRRSEASRRACENQNYETDYIAINTHTDNQIVNGITGENNIVTAAIDEDDTNPKSNKNRKDRKVKPRKASKQDSKVRIVNGKEVRINSDEPQRITAKENSSHAQNKSRASRKSNRYQNEDIPATAVENPKAKAETVTAQAGNKSDRKASDKDKEKKTVSASKQPKESKRTVQKEKPVKETASSRVKNAFGEKREEISTSEVDKTSKLNKGSRKRHSQDER